MTAHMSGVTQEALAEIERLRRANGGSVTPPAVVEAAADEASPLHAYFTWDDSVAAVAYRLEQARSLIRRVKITYYAHETTKTRVSAYVSVPAERHSGGGYRLASDLAGTPSAEGVVQEIASIIETQVMKLRALGDVMDVADIAEDLEAAALHLRRRVTPPDDTKRPRDPSSEDDRPSA
jgi:hypothetical protein